MVETAEMDVLEDGNIEGFQLDFFGIEGLESWCNALGDREIFFLVIDVDLYSLLLLNDPGDHTQLIRDSIEQILKQKAGEEDILVRIKEDRFLLASTKIQTEALVGIGRLITEKVTTLTNGGSHPTASGLVFSLPKDCGFPQDLSRYIDATMAKSKIIGRNTVRKADEVDQLAERTRILIVDDEGKIRDLHRMYLRSGNHELLTAGDGLEALAIIYTTPLDLIIMDISMPRMSGLEVLKKIKNDSRYKHIPVIILTAQDDRQTLLGAFRAGTDEFLAKPVQRTEFILRVNSMLTQKLQRDSLLKQSSIFRELVTTRMEISDDVDSNELLAQMCKSLVDIIGFDRSGIFGIKGDRQLEWLANYRLSPGDIEWIETTFLRLFLKDSQHKVYVNYRDLEKCKIYGIDMTMVAIPIIGSNQIGSNVIIGFGREIDLDNDILSILSIFASRVGQTLLLRDNNRVLQGLVKEKTAELQRSVNELNKVAQDTIYRLSIASEFRDNETGNHVKRIGFYSEAIARELGLSEEFVVKIKAAAPMHDVGKIGIPDHILLKPGRYTPEEFREMQKHPEIGAKILQGSRSSLLEMARIIALTHHEKWDGSGYPHGLKGTDIPIEGRIVSICDVFDALKSKRIYKQPFPTEKVLEILSEERGKYFDPKIYDVFISILQDKILPIFDEFVG